jgi:transcriptional regulator with XRE-family HTH domain
VAKFSKIIICHKKCGKIFDLKKMPQKVWQKNILQKIATAMKNSTEIQELLGMKQEDMAMLLQVTRVQWSMYVLGKRNLPIAAKLKLAEMLDFLTKRDPDSRKSFVPNPIEKSKRDNFFETQKITNKHQQTILENKLKVIEKKYNAGVIALKLVGFLETKTEEPTKENQNLWNMIKQNAKTDIEKSNLVVQEQLQLKLEVLQHEEMILHKKIQRM